MHRPGLVEGSNPNPNPNPKPNPNPGLVEGSAAVATAGMQLLYDGGGTREVLVTVHADVYAEVGLGLGLGLGLGSDPDPNPNRT